MNKIVTQAFLGTIKLYKLLVSPILGNRCRFHPTCSDYASEAVKEYGVGKGLYLGVKRVLRCSPLSKGGFDPVPKRLHHQQDNCIKHHGQHG